MTKTEEKNSEFDSLEDKLKREQTDKKKGKMLVSGKSVFTLQRIKKEKKEKDD